MRAANFRKRIKSSIDFKHSEYKRIGYHGKSKKSANGESMKTRKNQGKVGEVHV